MANPPDSKKKPGKTPKSKAHRPDVQPIGPALAELLTPAINSGESRVGSSTGLQPPPGNWGGSAEGGEGGCGEAGCGCRRYLPCVAPTQPSPASGRGLQMAGAQRACIFL